MGIGPTQEIRNNGGRRLLTQRLLRASSAGASCRDDKGWVGTEVERFVSAEKPPRRSKQTGRNPLGSVSRCSWFCMGTHGPIIHWRHIVSGGVGDRVTDLGLKPSKDWDTG